MNEIDIIKSVFSGDDNLVVGEIEDIFDLPLEFRELVYEESIIFGNEFDNADFSSVEGEKSSEDDVPVLYRSSQKIPALFMIFSDFIVMLLAIVNEKGTDIDHYLKFSFFRKDIDLLLGERPEVVDGD